MHHVSTNDKNVIDLTDYRRNLDAEISKAKRAEQTAEEALNEIARYLLMAVRVITERRSKH